MVPDQHRKEIVAAIEQFHQQLVPIARRDVFCDLDE
jgi:hypothetical protein